MNPIYTDEEATALILRAQEVAEIYWQAKEKDPKFTHADAVAFYERREAAKRAAILGKSLEQKLEEPSPMGDVFVTTASAINAVGSCVTKTGSSLFYEAIVGSLPERYRKYLCQKGEIKEKNAVSESVGAEFAIGALLSFGGVLAGSTLVSLASVYLLLEGICRAVAAEEDKALPSLLTKVPCVLLERKYGDLLHAPETKEIALQKYLDPNADKLPELPKQDILFIEEPKQLVRYERQTCTFAGLDGLRDGELVTKLMDYGEFKEATHWWYFEEKGKRVPTLMEFFQYARGLWLLRENPAYKDVIAACFSDLREVVSKYHVQLNTKINYGDGLKSSIVHGYADHTTHRIVAIPDFQHDEYYSSKLLLANGREEPIDFSSDEQTVLRALFGDDYNDAGPVLQYLTKWDKWPLPEVLIKFAPIHERPQDHVVYLESAGAGLVVQAKGYPHHKRPAIGLRLETYK
ncbi:hypothetical protein HY639_02000 [Candidatus Woesearchaeota archaeon]|nr:hypothetical protein [Candidatus Woesearchaeota archaeon]